MSQNLLKQCVAESVSTFTLIFIGAGVGLLGVASAGLISGRFLIKESK